MSDCLKSPKLRRSDAQGAVGGEDFSSFSRSSSSEGNHDYQWARFLRELAGVLVLALHIPDREWEGLLVKAGLSQVDVEEVAIQGVNPEIQVYKLLNKSKLSYENPNGWWTNFSRVVNNFGKDRMTKDVRRAYDKFIINDVTESIESEKWPPRQEVVGASPKASSPSFELINEEEVIKSSEDMKSKLKEEIEVMDPEKTQRFDEFKRTLQLVAKQSNSRLAEQLAGVVSDTLNLETSYRAVKTLNDILERENESQKKNLIRLTKENENQSREIDTLRQENEELKKTKADKQLTEFDVITKREASQAPDEGSTQKCLPVATAAITEEMVSFNAYKELQGRCVKLTSQRDQLVKVNHQWDQEYHLMENSLRAEQQSICQKVIIKDEEIMAGKRLIVAMEREKADCERKGAEVARELHALKETFEPLQEKCESEKEKCRKYHEYAIRLKEQKDKLEKEVARLNQVLSDSKLLKKGKGKAGPEKSSDQGTDHQTELNVYRQQAELYENDFQEEKREKQRLVGELNRIKEELRTVKKKARKMDEKFQMYQDEQMAQQLQEGSIPEDRYGNRNRSKMAQHVEEGLVPEDRYGTRNRSKMAQHVEEGLVPEDRYGRPRNRSKDRLLPHGGGLNFAGNDQFVDVGPLSSFGSIEADRAEETVARQQDEEENNVCPRCKDVFLEDDDFHHHLGECLSGQ